LTSKSVRPGGAVIEEVDPLELRDRLERGDLLTLVDVREPFERLLADLPDYGQTCIPVKELPSRGRDLDPEAEIVLYCRSGPRSAWATERLMEMGFPRVYNLKGGIMAWKAQVDPTLQGY
jgi:sulfur-carrier protein adenylyltransferase/sulfurtransferase